MKPLLNLCLVLFLAATAFAEEKPLEFADRDGRIHRPLVVGDKRAVVLVFVSPFCPISNAFTPEINRIAADYADKFAFFLIEAEADIKPEDAKKHAEVFEIKAPLLLDPGLRLAKLTKARVTPEAVVLAANGDTLYQGRVNDLYATPRKKLNEPTTRDLRDALDALLAGQPVPTPAPKAVGCSISGLE